MTPEPDITDAMVAAVMMGILVMPLAWIASVKYWRAKGFGAIARHTGGLGVAALLLVVPTIISMISPLLALALLLWLAWASFRVLVPKKARAPTPVLPDMRGAAIDSRWLPSSSAAPPPPDAPGSYLRDTAASPEQVRPPALSQRERIAQQFREEDDIGGWLAEHVHFRYRNAAGESSERDVVVHSAWPQRFNGYCVDRRERRTFRFDRIIGSVTRLETGELISVAEWRRDHLNLWQDDSQDDDEAITSGLWTGTTVVFTGFRVAEREELERLAESAGMAVRRKVSPRTDYLVRGPKEAPAKVNAALEHGADVLDADKFRAMVDA